MERPHEPAARPCDFWMWDGTFEYEGSVAKLADPGFTAHLRETRRAAGPAAGRRVNTTFFDLQRQFAGRRFLAFCRLNGEPRLQEVEVTSVQRSSTLDFDFFVCGRFWEIDDAEQALRSLPAHLRHDTE
jgi:hypothetical protein